MLGYKAYPFYTNPPQAGPAARWRMSWAVGDGSKRLKMSEGAVRVALHRALKSLAAWYRSETREDK